MDENPGFSGAIMKVLGEQDSRTATGPVKEVVTAENSTCGRGLETWISAQAYFGKGSEDESSWLTLGSLLGCASVVPGRHLAFPVARPCHQKFSSNQTLLWAENPGTAR